MIPSSFSYQRASSLEEAVGLLTDNDEARVLAGGHSLLPAMKLRMSTPGTLVDIGGLAELQGIEQKDSNLCIGAGVSHHEIESDGLVSQHAPALAQAAAVIGDVQVRNRGTMGGSIAHADPAADYPGALLALDAIIEIVGPGGASQIPAAEFFIDLFFTALSPGDIITGVTIPASLEGSVSCYHKFPQPASRFAVCGCAVWMVREGVVCKDARVALNGVGNTAFRDEGVEQTIIGQELTPENISSASARAAERVDVMEDVFAGEAYRRQLAKVYTRLALEDAAGPVR